jgi:hypothetical protein
MTKTGKYLLFIMIVIVSCGTPSAPQTGINGLTLKKTGAGTHPLAAAARIQIGTVTEYDTGYYKGGYPPEGRGACSDLVERALYSNGYDLKKNIDTDMKKNPRLYPGTPDPNINFRRVVNVKIFLDRFAEKLPVCVTDECFKKGVWQPGDIVTYDQIPGSLWHIAVVSDSSRPLRENSSIRVPLLIHNYGKGAVEDDLLLHWPAPISGHYRFKEFQRHYYNFN